MNGITYQWKQDPASKSRLEVSGELLAAMAMTSTNHDAVRRWGYEHQIAVRKYELQSKGRNQSSSKGTQYDCVLMMYEYVLMEHSSALEHNRTTVDHPLPHNPSPLS